MDETTSMRYWVAAAAIAVVLVLAAILWYTASPMTPGTPNTGDTITPTQTTDMMDDSTVISPNMQ